MEKKMGAFEARRKFGRILQDVVARGDKVVIERHGEAIAAVVPIEMYQQWKRRREAFFTRIQEAAETSQKYEELSEEEAMRIANEAVQAVRAQRQEQS